MSRFDPHSYADDTQPTIHHLDWVASVEFATRIISAEATLHLRHPASRSGPLDLDTRDLAIQSVETSSGDLLTYQLGTSEPILGSRLRVDLPQGTEALRIRYATAPNASALQWLEPEQTAGRSHPFLYTQCQAIHARSVVPLQDTPRHRMSYSASITVPAGLRALMAAAWEAREDTTQDTAVERFRMPQPIAPYLFAFAVGDLASRELSPRCRLWADPSVVDAAAWEFSETEQMLSTGETLFGPYEWDRYDILVLPPAFPFGGMENPRLTFLTPTAITGDRSQVSIVAHELAHSWTGNLVSNATAEHFWLNEGFTTYAERRIIEATYGPERAALEWAIGRRELEDALRLFDEQGRPELTRLRPRLEGVDPDEAYSVVPYEKGALLLRALEEAAGREYFDAFLRGYIGTFRFQALTTEEFAAYARTHLAEPMEQVSADVWINDTGLPEGAPSPTSSRLAQLEAAATSGWIPTNEATATWTSREWELYVHSLPRDISTSLVQELDARYELTSSRDSNLLAAWLEVAARAEYAGALQRTEELLGSVGRGKYLKPLYRELAGHPRTRPLARDWFERFKPRYHPIMRQVVEQLLVDQEA